MEQLADTLSTQLENLQRERERLERLLMLDANWRALQQLEAREAAGEPLVAVDAVGLKSSLERALANNRIYVARARLIESIELLVGAAAPEPIPLADRIVMLAAPTSEGFRTRLRLKEKPARVPAPTSIERDAPSAREVIEVEALGVLAVTLDAAPQPSSSTDPQTDQEIDQQTDQKQGLASPMRTPPDSLELIDGLDRSSVEQLIEGDVSRYREIAGWKNADVEHWCDRLGVDKGRTGAWIEQAAMLAQGHRTTYSVKARRGDFAVLVPYPEPLPAPVPIQHPEPAAAPVSTSVPVDPTPAIDAFVVAQSSVTGASEANFELAAGAEDLAGADGVTAETVVPPLPVDAGSVGSDAFFPASHSPAEPDSLRSAGELIRKLASASSPVVPPAFHPGTEARRPYVRPEARREVRHDRRGEDWREDDAAAAHSEVIVIRRDPQRAPPGPGFAQAERPRPQRLLRRLKQALEPNRFEADGYAAYRGVAEEASVTILRAEPERAHPIAREPASARSATGYNRFLKALTGQR